MHPGVFSPQVVFEAAFMLRKTLFVSTSLAAVMSFAAPMISAQAGSSVLPMPPDRAADSYAIYSLLMPGDTFNSMSPEQNQRWAIADTTVSISDMNPAVPPEGQLRAPRDHPKRFQEAVRDFEARKYERIQLTDQFDLPKPHTLMTADDVAQFRHARTAVDASSSLRSSFAGYPGINFFSQVFFNSGHTAALVFMNNWCGHLCASGQWIYLEKHDGKWVRRSGITSRTS
jgi:hypothetical protein